MMEIILGQFALEFSGSEQETSHGYQSKNDRLNGSSSIIKLILAIVFKLITAIY